MAEAFPFLLALSLALTSAAGWFTHLFWTFGQDTLANVLLGVFGLIAAPIGVLHGIWLWF